MNEKNQEAQALGFKRARAKSLAIKELGLTPKLSAKKVDAIIEERAQAKAVAKDTSLADEVKGQRWYIEDLIAFSTLSAQERLDKEYKAAFADCADENEMLAALEELC